MASLTTTNIENYLTYSFKGIKLNEKSNGIVILTHGDVIPYKSVARTITHFADGRHHKIVVYDLIATIKYNEQEIDIPLSYLDIYEIEEKE